MRKLAWLVAAALVAGSFASVAALSLSRRPRVSITRVHQDLTQGTVVRGRASDNRGVRRVMVSIDGGTPMRAHCRCVRPHVRWRLVLPLVDQGTHELRITVVDDRGHRRRITRTYRVASDAAPSASLNVYRAFTDSSWWNLPMPATTPVDAASGRWIAALSAATTGEGWLKLTGASGSTSQAQPVYFSGDADPVFTIDPKQGPTVTVHIPTEAEGSGAPNPKMTVIDRSTDQGVGLFGATYSAGHWTATGVDRYFLSSNGLHEDLGGQTGNSGHRGATMVEKAPRLDEVEAGAIAHRTECFLPPKLVGVSSVWPMTGSDGGNAGGIPEGVVLRIRPSVDLAAKGLSAGALVIARSLQEYGCMITDGGSSRAATIRLQRADWSAMGVNKDSLETLTWDDWEFVQGGYHSW